MPSVQTPHRQDIRFADRVGQIGTENAFKIGPYIRRIETQGRHVIKCNLGEPDFAVPAHIRNEVKRQLDADNTHYCDPQGLPSLRRVLAAHLSDTRGIRVTADRVVIFPGAKPPIGLSQQVYVDPGDEVIYPSPGFPIYESFTRYVGAIPVPLSLRPEKSFSVDGNDLATLLSPRTRLIFLNFPSNPTGGVATKEQLEDLAKVVQSQASDAVRLYSDEVYEDILFDGASHHSIASIPGMAERTIIVSGASKSYAWTGGRIGWAAFPTAEEARVFTNLNINYFSCVPPYNQEGARVALSSEESKTGIRHMVNAFRARRDEVVTALNRIDGISCRIPRGAFYVFPDISGMCERLGVFEAYESLSESTRALTSPSTLVQMFLLFRYRVATMDRNSFGSIGAEGQHYLRISIATAVEELREAMERISRAAGDREGFAEFMTSGDPLY